MITIDYDKEYLIYGTGIEACEIVYSLQDKIRIRAFVERAPQISNFCNKPVFEANMSIMKDYYIIIAVRKDEYHRVASRFNDIGYSEFTDYIYWEWLLKKIVVIHGNCHMDIVKKYLETSDTFNKYYTIYPNQPIQNNKKKYIDPLVLKNCDVFIHQDIQSTNQFGFYLSDEYISEFLTDSTQDIIVPNLFGLGGFLFPQNYDDKGSTLQLYNSSINNGSDNNGLFPHTDYIIDRLLVESACGVTDWQCFAKMCLYNSGLTRERILDNFEIWIRRIKDRQADWDIEVYDFILKNYSEVKLFYDPGHPTNILIRHIVEGILALLSINDELIEIKDCMDYHENPVYPVVSDTLGLKWKDNTIRNSSYAKKLKRKMDFNEYVTEYAWWKFELLREQISKRIRHYDKDNTRRYAIIPYGNCGKMCDHILGEMLGKKLAYRVDNNKQQYGVVSLDSISCDEVTFIIATVREEIDREICEQLKDMNPNWDIIHVMQGWVEF